MKNLIIKKNKGLTLVELIIGVVLFGIISISLVSLFVNGFSLISRSGRRTEALYKNQNQIETNLLGDPIQENISFTFDSREIVIDINKFLVEQSYGNNNNSVNIIYFQGRFD